MVEGIFMMIASGLVFQASSVSMTGEVGVLRWIYGHVSGHNWICVNYAFYMAACHFDGSQIFVAPKMYIW